VDRQPGRGAAVHWRCRATRMNQAPRRAHVQRKLVPACAPGCGGAPGEGLAAHMGVDEVGLRIKFVVVKKLGGAFATRPGGGILHRPQDRAAQHVDDCRRGLQRASSAVPGAQDVAHPARAPSSPCGSGAHAAEGNRARGPPRRRRLGRTFVGREDREAAGA